ncbi:MAG: hypothetical protein ACK52S_02220 [Pirellula sp.]
MERICRHDSGLKAVALNANAVENSWMAIKKGRQYFWTVSLH